MDHPPSAKSFKVDLLISPLFSQFTHRLITKHELRDSSARSIDRAWIWSGEFPLPSCIRDAWARESATASYLISLSIVFAKKRASIWTSGPSVIGTTFASNPFSPTEQPLHYRCGF